VFLTLTTLFAVAGGVMLSLQAAPFEKKKNRWLWLPWALAPFSSFQAFLTGQSSFLEVGLFEFFLWSWLAKREIVCGACLALSTIKPHYAIFMLLPAMVAKRWHTLASFVVCEILLLVGTSCLIGVDNIISYPRTVLGMDTGMNVNAAGMPCLRGLLSNLIADQHTVMKICLVALAAALGYLFYLWRKAIDSSDENQLWLMIVSILMALAFSPHSHLYDYVLFAPAALLIASWNVIDLLEIKSPPLMIWSLILFCYPFLTWFLILCPVIDRWHPLILCALLFILIACGLPQLRRQSRVAG
jgi:hypothetical protein